MKTIGGHLFVRMGHRFDYCFREAINCLLEFTDEVVVCYVESDDGTLESLEEIQKRDSRLKIIYQSTEQWNAQQGKEKLAYFQNLAAAELKTDYQFLLQADEILHQDCYDAVKQALKTQQEAFMVKRINLWGSPFTQLNVPQWRKPCSTEIIRLTKVGYKSYGDGESINAQCVDWFTDRIRIYHMGFTRRKDIHPDKIREMQGNIFQCGVDSKLDGMEVFDPTKWFDPKEDLKPLDEPLPAIINQWAIDRI